MNSSSGLILVGFLYDGFQPRALHLSLALSYFLTNSGLGGGLGCGSFTLSYLTISSKKVEPTID